MSQCISTYRCKRCWGNHHTLLHHDTITDTSSPPAREEPSNPPAQSSSGTRVVANTAVKLKSNTLLITCQVIASSPDGTTTQARALLDTGSAASFVSECLATGLNLTRSHQTFRISGIAGSFPSSQTHSAVNLFISSSCQPEKKLNLTAVVLPKITQDLPVSPVSVKGSWRHLQDIQLADPHFGKTGRIDLLLGIDVYAEIERQGRRRGPPGSPVAFETELGWVLGGLTDEWPIEEQPSLVGTSCLMAVLDRADILQRFWEVEEPPKATPILTPEERAVMQHFNDHHTRTPEGRFVVPLPKKPDDKQLGESRTQAVRRFLVLERSLTHSNGSKMLTHLFKNTSI